MIAGGQALLFVALAGLLVSLAGYGTRLRAGRGAVSASWARGGYLLFVCAAAGAGVWLVALFLRHDFRVVPVYAYSSRDLPLAYLISAVWAGQEGSFLLWVVLGAVVGLALMRTARELEAPAMVVYELGQLSLLLLLFAQSPFRLMEGVPPDGRGLNPLLQDFWMAIHPPLVFAGYALIAVPFALALAACWRGEANGWVGPALPWAGFGFAVLGAGIMVGGVWAYRVLGWGGYWGWDPVENASLLPWLTCGALIHGLLTQRAVGRFVRANLALASLAYLLVIYGTFLTRSGVLSRFSVHSFSSLGITGWLVAVLGFHLVLISGLLARRWRGFMVRTAPPSWWSREIAMLLTMAVLMASTLLVGLGTSAPLLTWYRAAPATVDPSYYTRTHLPIAIALGILLAAGPLLPWGGWKGRPAWGAWTAAAGAGLAIAASSLLLGYRGVGPMLVLALAGTAGVVQARLLAAQLRAGVLRCGGHTVHLGVAFMLVGIVFSGACGDAERVVLERNVPGRGALAAYEFLGMRHETPSEKPAMEVRVVYRGRPFLARPRMYADPRWGRSYADPHIERFLLGDVYIEPVDYQPPVVELARGESAFRFGYRILFEDFEVERHDPEGDGEVAIRARLLVHRGDVHEAVSPRLLLGASGSRSEPAELPGGEFEIRLLRILADEHAIVLRLERASAAGGAGEGIDTAAPEVLVVDVSTKPVIGLLWIGVGLVAGGGLLAGTRRLTEGEKAVRA